MSVQKVSDAMITALSASKLTGTVVDSQVDSLNASKLTGTVADARFPATLPAISGANLTGGLAKTSTAQTWTASQRSAMVVDNDGSFDMNAGHNFKCTPTGNFTLTFTNISDGQSGFILLVNSGGHTVSLQTYSKADANLATTVTAAGTYILSYISDGTCAYLTNSAVIA